MRILKPFIGLDDYELLQSVQKTKDMLNAEKISYEEEYDPNEDLTVKVPWTVLKTTLGIDFYFAKDKLFKIDVEAPFDGQLENGISIGMPMEKAKQVDPSLLYDDWNEDWNSELGYWLIDDLDNDTVSNITIFIKEIIKFLIFPANDNR